MSTPIGLLLTQQKVIIICVKSQKMNSFILVFHSITGGFHMDLNTMIGLKIAALRRQHNMTQEQLAEKLDISIKHCSEVERGLSRLSLEKLIDVSSLFDVSLDYLLKDSPVVPPTYDYICNEFPPSIVNIMRSENNTEINLLREYLNMYTKLRNTKK